MAWTMWGVGTGHGCKAATKTATWQGHMGRAVECAGTASSAWIRQDSRRCHHQRQVQADRRRCSGTLHTTELRGRSSGLIVKRKKELSVWMAAAAAGYLGCLHLQADQAGKIH